MTRAKQVRINTETQDVARRFALDLGAQLGRQISQPKALSAAVRVAAAHPSEHAAAFREDFGAVERDPARVDPDAHELLLAMTLSLGRGVGRLVTLREALATAVVVAGRHSDQLADALSTVPGPGRPPKAS